MQAVNYGLILAAAWRIADQPNGLLYKTLKSKYFSDSSIWRPKPNITKSALWTSILKVIPLLQSNAFYQITSGNISIWSTPWCTAWTRVYDDLIIQNPGFVYPSQVKDLWLPNLKAWNHTLIDSIFLQPTAQSIKSTPILNCDEGDILCWKLTPMASVLPNPHIEFAFNFCSLQVCQNQVR